MNARHLAGSDAPPTRRIWSVAANLLLLAFIMAIGWAFWPTTLGGCSTFTIVSGRSMEPTYVTGDLVLARCGEPQIGDVVVYQPLTDTDARVIHRIIGGSAADGWVLQGDNNNFIDPWNPTNDQVLGRAVLHIPNLGRIVFFLSSPYVWFSLFVAAGGLLLWPPKPGAGQTGLTEQDGQQAGEPAEPVAEVR